MLRACESSGLNTQLCIECVPHLQRTDRLHAFLFYASPEGLRAAARGCKVREDRGRQPAAAEKSFARHCWEGNVCVSGGSSSRVIFITSVHSAVSPPNHSCVCVQSGLTPLHVAAHYDNQKVALLLLNQGASPHAAAKVREYGRALMHQCTETSLSAALGESRLTQIQSPAHRAD